MCRKVVIITGSPRKSGNSFGVTDAFIRTAFYRTKLDNIPDIVYNVISILQFRREHYYSKRRII